LQRKRGWPEYDEELIKDDSIILGIQVNGKLRGEVELPIDADKNFAISEARKNEKVAKYLVDVEVVKEIYVPGKIVGFVVK